MDMLSYLKNQMQQSLPDLNKSGAHAGILSESDDISDIVILPTSQCFIQ